jgi:hypothetical protein
MDIPANPDGGEPSGVDELLSAGPSILDEMVAPSPYRLISYWQIRDEC